MHISPIRALLTSITLLALTACGVSDNFPVAAVSATTAGVVRISTSGLSSESLRQTTKAFATMLSQSTISALAQGTEVLNEQAAKLEPANNQDMRRLDETMASLRQINAKAIYVIVDGTAAEQMLESYTVLPIEQDGIMILVQTTSASSQGDIQSVVAKAFDVAVIVESLGQGWYWLKANPDEKLPAVPDLIGAQKLDGALNALSGSAVSFGMRVTTEIKAACATAFDSDTSGMAMFLGGFMEPLEQLTTVSAAVNFGPNPTVRMAMTFATKESAGEFNQAWATTTRSVFSMVGMMAAGNVKGEKAIDPKTFSDMAAALTMVQAEDRLIITLDDAAWKKLIP
ncbi:MAG: hypothetical protein EXS17_03870 [Phycisphaerales bacterium]|nr:hypothetical protein [Phycisphaerales bacterium]